MASLGLLLSALLTPFSYAFLALSGMFTSRRRQKRRRGEHLLASFQRELNILGEGLRGAAEGRDVRIDGRGLKRLPVAFGCELICSARKPAESEAPAQVRERSRRRACPLKVRVTLTEFDGGMPLGKSDFSLKRVLALRERRDGCDQKSER